MVNIDLTNKNIIITGSSKGIGKGIADMLAMANGNIVIVSRHLDEAKNVADELEKKFENIKSFALEADVSKTNEIENMVNEVINRWGKVDILINNAGTATRSLALDMTEVAWNRMVDTDLKGAFFCSKEVAKHMKKKGGGIIINIGSVHSITPMKLYSAYGACKAGITQLTKVLALEWAEYNILVNCVAPGSVPTDINKEWLSNPKNLQSNISRTLLRRLGTSKDIAGAVLFLCSEYSSYITGQTIYVDGGWTI